MQVLQITGSFVLLKSMASQKSGNFTHLFFDLSLASGIINWYPELHSIHPLASVHLEQFVVPLVHELHPVPL